MLDINKASKKLDSLFHKIITPESFKSWLKNDLLREKSTIMNEEQQKLFVKLKAKYDNTETSIIEKIILEAYELGFDEGYDCGANSIQTI